MKTNFKSTTQIEQKIYQSIRNSSEFDNKLQVSFTELLLEAFIRRNGGLQKFLDSFVPDEFEIELIKNNLSEVASVNDIRFESKEEFHRRTAGEGI